MSMHEIGVIELEETTRSRYYNARAEKGRVYEVDGGFVYRDSIKANQGKYYLFVSRGGKFYIGEMPGDLLYTHLQQMKLYKVETKYTALYYGKDAMEAAVRQDREKEGTAA